MSEKNDLIKAINELIDARVDAKIDEVLKHVRPTPVINFPAEPMVKIDAAADYLGVTVRHVRQLVSANKIPHYKVGGSVRFKLSELDARTRVSLKAAS